MRLRILVLILLLFALCASSAPSTADIIVLTNGEEVSGRLEAEAIHLVKENGGDLTIPLRSIQRIALQGDDATVELVDGTKIHGRINQREITVASNLFSSSFQLDQISEIRINAHNEDLPFALEDIETGIEYPELERQLQLSLPLAALSTERAFLRNLNNIRINQAFIRSLRISREDLVRSSHISTRIVFEVPRSHDRKVDFTVTIRDSQGVMKQGFATRKSILEGSSGTFTIGIKVNKKRLEESIQDGTGTWELKVVVEDKGESPELFITVPIP